MATAESAFAFAQQKTIEDQLRVQGPADAPAPTADSTLQSLIQEGLAAANPATKVATKVDSKAAFRAAQSAVATNTEQLVSSVASLKGGANKAEAAAGKTLGALGSVGTSKQVLTLQADTARLQAETANRAAVAAAGGLDTQLRLAKNLREEGQRRDDLLDERTDIMNDEFTGIGIIDNIINGFRAVGVESDLRSVQLEFANTADRISTIAASTESIARFASLNEQTVTDATIEANQQAVLAATTVEQQKVILQNTATNANLTATIMSAQGRVADNITKAYQFENQEENQEQRRLQFDFELKKNAEAVKQWRDGAAARAKNLEQAELNLVRTRATNPTGIPAAIAKNEAAIKAMDNAKLVEASFASDVQVAQAKAWIAVEEPEVIIAGLASRNIETVRRYELLQQLGANPKAPIAPTPYDSKVNLSIINPSSNRKATKATTMLDEIDAQQVEDFKKAGAAIPKTVEAAKASYNDSAKAYVLVKSSNIATGDLSNPYHGDPFSELAKVNSVAGTKLYKEVLAVKDMKELNPELILSSAVAGIIGGHVDAEEAAAGIVAIFARASDINNSRDGGFSRVGLPNQESYNVQVRRDPSVFEQLKSELGEYLGAPIRLVSILGGATRKEIRASIDKAKARFQILNLMDVTRVRAYITEELGKQTPPTTTPTASN